MLNRYYRTHWNVLGGHAHYLSVDNWPIGRFSKSTLSGRQFLMWFVVFTFVFVVTTLICTECKQMQSKCDSLSHHCLLFRIEVNDDSYANGRSAVCRNCRKEKRREKNANFEFHNNFSFAFYVIARNKIVLFLVNNFLREKETTKENFGQKWLSVRRRRRWRKQKWMICSIMLFLCFHFAMKSIKKWFSVERICVTFVTSTNFCQWNKSKPKAKKKETKLCVLIICIFFVLIFVSFLLLLFFIDQIVKYIICVVCKEEMKKADSKNFKFRNFCLA